MIHTRINREVKDIERFQEIIRKVIAYGFGYLMEKSKLLSFLPIHKRISVKEEMVKAPAATRLRVLFEELGPAFIKFGQLLSLRPDLIPREYCEELAKLQDEVPPVPFTEVRRAILKETGKTVERLFKAIEPEPIASASIAQVHRAILKNNKVVAVKVQRPKADDIIARDIDILMFAARILKRHLPQQVANPVQIIEEYKRYTESELDFEREAKNITIFRKNFKGHPAVTIPEVVSKLSSKKLLVMEYMHGAKLSSIIKGKHKMPPKDKKKLAATFVDSILEQVFIHGFFHADPHPGNILYHKNRLTYLDFGIVGFFDREMKETAFNLFKSMLLGDVDKMCMNLIELDATAVSTNMELLKEDMMFSLSKYYDVGLAKVNFAEAFHSILSIAKQNNVHIPPTLVLLGKCVITTEGVALQLDPSFNIINQGLSFLAKARQHEHSPRKIATRVIRSVDDMKEFLLKLPKQTTEMLIRAKDAESVARSIDADIQNLTTEIDRSSNRVAIGLLVTAFLISSALLSAAPQPLLWGFPAFTFVGFSIASLLILIVFGSILKEKRY